MIIDTNKDISVYIISLNLNIMERGVKLGDENEGCVGKLSKYYMEMTQFWYLKQESISSIWRVSLKGPVIVWG